MGLFISRGEFWFGRCQCLVAIFHCRARTSKTPAALRVESIGGLVVSQLLTLYITPVFYLYMERFTKYVTPTPVPADAEHAHTEPVMAK